MQEFIQNNQYIQPAVVVAISLVLGYIFQKFILGKLAKISKKTKWKGDDIIIKNIDSAPVLWFLLIGVYFALQDLPIPAYYKDLSWQVLLIVLVLSSAIIISRISIGFIEYYAEKSSGKVQSTSIFNILTKGLIFVLAGLIVLQTFGISITPILTALGIGGLAIALALQETLSNLFAGLQLVASKKFMPGDFIELESGDSGYIEDISWRNTIIKTMANNLIIIPNSKIASATVKNYARPQSQLSVLVSASVSYNSNLEHVEEIAKEVGKEVLKRVEGGVKSFTPLVRFNNFGESGIDFIVILRAKEFVGQYLLKHEFIKALHKRFNEEGIEIPFPQRVMHMEKPE